MKPAHLTHALVILLCYAQDSSSRPELPGRYLLSNHPCSPTLSKVSLTLDPGNSAKVDQDVTNAASLDFCYLMDCSGSFNDDINLLQKNNADVARSIYRSIKAMRNDSYFAVAGFIDYPEEGHGAPSDFVYQLFSPMSQDEADWVNGIFRLQARGGGDATEAQYDAIVAATGVDGGTFDDPTLGVQQSCDWRACSAQKILTVLTDSAFHEREESWKNHHVHNERSTIQALNKMNIAVLGLKGPGAGNELDNLALATGGSCERVASDGTDIATQITKGLSAIICDVFWVLDSVDRGLNVAVTPEKYEDCKGGEVAPFEEVVSVDSDPSLRGSVLMAKLLYKSTAGGDTVLHEQVIEVSVPNVTTTSTTTSAPSSNTTTTATTTSTTTNTSQPSTTTPSYVVVPVTIDIGPKCVPKLHRCDADGTIAVAVMSTQSFDASQIDPSTVAFGKTGTEVKVKVEQCGGSTGTLAYVTERADVSVPPDGLVDVVFHFDADKIGLNCANLVRGSNRGTFTGILTGMASSSTSGRIAIVGTGSFDLVRPSFTSCPRADRVEVTVESSIQLTVTTEPIGKLLCSGIIQ